MWWFPDEVEHLAALDERVSRLASAPIGTSGARPTAGPTCAGARSGRHGREASGSAVRSCLRELIPSLVNTLRRCHSTVRGLRNS